ncbi:MAG TPA: SDR family oxidoreductase [Candidatus Onthousia excrementipullorum]|uniref:SDR family oxidoreductase n=1 Tax=Candidatus Onthousia excrementipullorum TaxID=2840884 RepID=A0A9D1DUU1_9FIRM|nr:SDR family oxidoreductase [Candidatus Onthousia excrementipullorum]
MGKVIVITGGSDGLGRTLTESLSQENDVIILATNEQKLIEVANSNNCNYEVCDVSNYKLVEKSIKKIIDNFGRIDVLINNAGLWIQEELELNDSDRINSVVDVNLLGVINCSKAVIPIMKNNKEGLIININSQAGINHKAERVVYNATKWGVTGFSKSLQDEVAKYGIRVTNVMPGMMKTNMFKKMNIQKNMDNGLDTKEVARLIEFIIDTPSDVMIPEVGIKNINN